MPLYHFCFFEKKTYTGLLTNYLSFTSFQYKLGLIKTLIDRAYKINDTTHTILRRNMFPSSLIVNKHDVSTCHYTRKISSFN